MFTSERSIRLDGAETNEDYFEIDNVTYQALPLDFDNADKGIGINSSVFIARRVDDETEFAVKICAFYNSRYPHYRARRFQREIEAMRRAVAHHKTSYVVEILGTTAIPIRHPFGTKMHQAYICPKADGTLAEFLENTPNLVMQQRLLLCAELLNCIDALHSIGVYHRDIKPENFLLFGSEWKVGDLGLIQFREDDSTIDLARERIGPIKWMTPEAFNKQYWIDRNDNQFVDRNFCERSDIYLLGKLFWYIIQGDIPNGVLKGTDLVVADSDIYGGLLKPMLNYRRSDRPTASVIMQRLLPLRRRYAF